MSHRFLSGPIDLLHAGVLAALLILVFTHLPAGCESYKVRDRVLVGLQHADPVVSLVVANALAGRDFTQGWAGSVANPAGEVRVDAHTGVVTITYSADIDGGGKTLTLVPMYLRDSQTSPLATAVKSKRPLEAANIIWLCTSKLTLSREVIISDNLGSLQSKYVPAVCRLPWPEDDLKNRAYAPTNN